MDVYNEIEHASTRGPSKGPKFTAIMAWSRSPKKNCKKKRITDINRKKNHEKNPAFSNEGFIID